MTGAFYVSDILLNLIPKKIEVKSK